jgi:ketose-bisphosphate aldolase
VPLASTLDMLRRARKEGYAVAGFEPYTLEQIQAVIETAEEERAPVLIQLWAEVIATWGIETLSGIVREAAERARVPVGLHLDHATDEVLIKAALDAGFTSVMFDGSTLPLEENIVRTRAVVEKAHARGIAVEAELGLIGHLRPQDDVEAVMEQIASLLTDAPTAQKFVRETGLDILAPAVGTIHGCKLPVARLDIPRIAAIAEATGVPLALHGGSGVGDAAIRQAIAAGIAKVNIDTEVRAVTIAALKTAVAAIGTTDAPIFMDFALYPRAVKTATREAVRNRLRMVGASGKA